MREAGGSAYVNPISPSLIGFKPRQVLLAEKQQQKRTLMAEQESILTYSVALWLQTKGFSKALKRFLSSAQIQDEDWKSKALDLNEIFFKHLPVSNDVQEKESPQEKMKKKKKEKESMVVGSAQINGVVNGEKTESKKKKKTNKGEDAMTDNGKMSDEMASTEKVEKSKAGGKQKKKHKTSDVLSDSKPKSELNENDPDNAVEKKASKKRSIDATEGDDESKKTSKKRKRIAVDETEDQPSEEAVQELKPKKSKGSKEGKDVHTQNKEETSVKDIAVGSKDDVKNEVDKFSNSKSGRKQNDNSSEPKTVNAFQRVKIDEVKFADERLQDNSYWAKDGAEIGYGAKAQEVLGQVRGRDFRHEKTKKKRGSYRGGQIDLQSHSIKFDNSDDE